MGEEDADRGFLQCVCEKRKTQKQSGEAGKEAAICTGMRKKMRRKGLCGGGML